MPRPGRGAEYVGHRRGAVVDAGDPADFGQPAGPGRRARRLAQPAETPLRLGRLDRGLLARAQSEVERQQVPRPCGALLVFQPVPAPPEGLLAVFVDLPRSIGMRLGFRSHAVGDAVQAGFFGVDLPADLVPAVPFRAPERAVAFAHLDAFGKRFRRDRGHRIARLVEGRRLRLRRTGEAEGQCRNQENTQKHDEDHASPAGNHGQYGTIRPPPRQHQAGK